MKFRRFVDFASGSSPISDCIPPEISKMMEHPSPSLLSNPQGGRLPIVKLSPDDMVHLPFGTRPAYRSSGQPWGIRIDTRFRRSPAYYATICKSVAGIYYLGTPTGPESTDELFVQLEDVISCLKDSWLACRGIALDCVCGEHSLADDAPFNLPLAWFLTELWRLNLPFFAEGGLAQHQAFLLFAPALKAGGVFFQATSLLNPGSLEGKVSIQDYINAGIPIHIWLDIPENDPRRLALWATKDPVAIMKSLDLLGFKDTAGTLVIPSRSITTFYCSDQYNPAFTPPMDTLPFV